MHNTDLLGFSTNCTIPGDGFTKEDAGATILSHGSCEPYTQESCPTPKGRHTLRYGKPMGRTYLSLSVKIHHCEQWAQEFRDNANSKFTPMSNSYNSLSFHVFNTVSHFLATTPDHYHGGYGTRGKYKSRDIFPNRQITEGKPM
jgi:hypothetical protein